MKRIVAALLAVAFAAPTHAADDAKALFSKKCAACHGPDGKGQTAMGQKLGAKDLTTLKLAAGDVATDIEKGKGKMPAVKGLTAEEVQAVAKYVSGGLK
jgi:mono/diheme cytochrome c family protein